MRRFAVFFCEWRQKGNNRAGWAAKEKKMKENGKYCFLQGGYWMLFCTSYGYVTYYLMGAGYTFG